MLEGYGILRWSATQREYDPDSGWSTSSYDMQLISVPTGAVRVQLSPPEAVAAGAQWRVDGGAWQNSGATVSALAPGGHSLEFRLIAGWIAPPPEMVTITADTTLDLTRLYVVAPGSLRVTILPPEAVQDGAHWRVDGGLWQATGAIVSNLQPGPHTVACLPLPGWISPPPQSVSILAGQLTEIEVTYMRTTAVRFRQWTLYR